MKFLCHRKSKTIAQSLPPPLPLGIPRFAILPAAIPVFVNLLDIPQGCMNIILDKLSDKDMKEMRLGSSRLLSVVDRLGVTKVEIRDEWSFSLAKRFKSLLIIDLHLSSDEELIQLISLTASLPLLHTLHIRTKAMKLEERGWLTKLLRGGRSSSDIYKPSSQAFSQLVRSLDNRQRFEGVRPSLINLVCHFPVELHLLSAFQIDQEDTRLSISIPETMFISSPVPFNSYFLLTELKIDLSLHMASSLFGPQACSPIQWPPRLKKLDIGIVPKPQPNSDPDFVISSRSMSGMSRLASLESFVIRGEAVLSPCFFDLLGTQKKLGSATFWMRRHWLEIRHLMPLSLLPSFTSLQVARLDLGNDTSSLPCLPSVVHLNYYLLEGGDLVLQKVFPSITHSVLRDWPLCSDPIHLSGLSRSFNHLTLMQHSPCPPPEPEPNAMVNNAAVNRHFSSLQSISLNIKTLSFKNIQQHHHIGPLFDLIRSNFFPLLLSLSVTAKEGSSFTSSGRHSPLFPLNPLRLIPIQEIVLDAGETSWAAHRLLIGCSLPRLTSLTIRQIAPIQIPCLLSILEGTTSLQSISLPSSFSKQNAIWLKRELRSTIDPQVSIESDPEAALLEKKKRWRVPLMECLAPRE